MLNIIIFRKGIVGYLLAIMREANDKAATAPCWQVQTEAVWHSTQLAWQSSPLRRLQLGQR